MSEQTQQAHHEADEQEWSIDAASMVAVAASAPPALVEELLPAQSVITFAGEPGIGKSFVALSIAACVAEGRPWFGRAVSGPAPVAYVVGEGWGQFGRRVAALQADMGVELGPNLRFVDGQRRGVDLGNPATVGTLARELEAIGPALVVFDTFSMLANIRSENDNAEVAKVFAVAHKLVRATGASVMLVHHVSKVAGAVRGATAFRGNADSVVVAHRSKVEGDHTFFLSTRASDDGKQRDMEATRIDGFSIASPGVLVRSSNPVVDAATKAAEAMAAQGVSVADILSA